jgi:hypothetical protein
MRRARMAIALLAASVVFQAGTVPLARAEQRNEFPAAVATGVFSALATVVAVPLKFATCTAVAAVGGAGYGLTLGQSDFVRQELLSGIPRACGIIMHTTAPEVTPYLEGPQPDAQFAGERGN